MTRRPYRQAVCFAVATIGGLVGLMLVSGWWGAPFLALASIPAALCVRGMVSNRRVARHTGRADTYRL